MLSPFRKHLRAYLAREHSKFFYHAVAFAPRVLLHCASLAAVAGLASGCVAETRYEEARSAGQVEMGARQRAEQRLHEAELRLATLEADVKARDQRLSADEDVMSQSKLDGDVLAKERDEQTQLVEQLRGELARVGGDLRAFAEQKTSLERALSAAEARKKRLEQSDAQAASLVRATRDLSALLGDGVLSGELSLDLRDGMLVLRVPRDKLLADDKVARSDAALAAVARVLERYPELTLALSEPGRAADHADLAAITAALAERGVALPRLRRVASDSKADSAEIELALAPSAPQPDSTAPSAPQLAPSERAGL